MNLQQGIFRNRLERINQFVNKAFEETSDQLLNDNNLLQSLKQQIKQEQEVVGRPTFSMKPSIFETHWKFMTGIKTHAGTEITKSGILMDESYLKRQKIVEEIEKKNVAREELMRRESQLLLSEGKSAKNFGGPSMRNLKSNLEIVQEYEVVGDDFFSAAKTFDRK